MTYEEAEQAEYERLKKRYQEEISVNTRLKCRLVAAKWQRELDALEKRHQERRKGNEG